MDTGTIVSLVGIVMVNAGTLFSMHVRTQTNMARQHERIKRLESDNSDLKMMVREVVDGIHAIRNLLAANSIR
jgi:hypothetical protein